ncbi:S41 family peptidase [Streptomyces sp. NPDC001339]|uniref:S41 family peptidase n=1 Tax=Streptomyces sp. NPDC001339 TaxID=3364563 RepID=UPI0036C100F2
MSGPWSYDRPRRMRRGAALTLFLAGVLAAGSVTGTWGDAAEGAAGRNAPDRAALGAHAPLPHALADRATVERAASEALADGKSGAQAAAEVVSRSGDRWSTVYTPGEFEDFQQQLDGTYVGVGLWVRQADGGRIEVSRVQSGSPAARAGIAAGDRLHAIDGLPAQGRPVTDIVARLRGSVPHGSRSAGPGTTVRLDLRRGTRHWSATLHRARLHTRNVTVSRPAGTGGPTRVRVASFAKGTGDAVRRAVRRALRAEGLVLDLRGNTGGLVAESVATASVFLDGGLVATYDVRGDQRALYAERGGNTRLPLVVLVDGGTMSAAELLAGALQDRGRAVLVGSPTFGKGSVQMPTRLPDGSVAELTVGHYRTPSGRTVDGAGITPDLVVDGQAEKRARKVLSGLGTGA